MSKTKAVSVPKLGKHEKRERLMGYLLAAPAVVLLLLFTVYPLMYLFYRSLFSGNLITKNPKFVGFENYANLIKSEDFHQVLSNTVIYTLITVVLTMVLAVPLAISMTKKIRQAMEEML